MFIAISALQVAHGEPIEVNGSGFTPNQTIVSHLLKPDQTEHPVLQFFANEKGEFSHRIDTLLLVPGAYELWVVEHNSDVRSNRVRFTVGFGNAFTPEVERVIARYAGVWRSSTILVALTNKAAATAGTFAYLDRSCGGLLGYRRIATDSMEVSETLLHGTGNCPANSVVILRLTPEGKLAFSSRNPSVSRTDTLTFVQD